MAAEGKARNYGILPRLWPLVALLASPAMPDTSAEIWRRLGLDGRPEQCRLPQDAAWGGYPGGRPG